MKLNGLALSCLVVLLFGGGSRASTNDFATIEKRIDELQPTPAEKRFDEIGWAKDIRHARQLASQLNRPVFLFTHDGRMNLGRC